MARHPVCTGSSTVAGRARASRVWRMAASPLLVLMLVACDDSSDLVQGRVDRAGTWLARARQLSQGYPQEMDYWRGRFEEISAKPSVAVGRYIAAAERQALVPRIGARGSAHDLCS